MPCEDQEEKAPQGSSRAGTLISDFQPPELWEVNVCCLSQPLFGICYSSLSSPRYFLHFRLHNLNSPVFRSAHEPHPAIFLCSYHTSSLQNLYIFFVLTLQKEWSFGQENTKITFAPVAAGVDWSLGGWPVVFLLPVTLYTQRRSLRTPCCRDLHCLCVSRSLPLCSL